MAAGSITPSSSFKSEIYGLSNEVVEKITSSSPNIDSITVENSADVTIGNRTYFNPPIMQEDVNFGKMFDDPNTAKQFESNGRNIYHRNSRALNYCIGTALAVILTTFVLVICFSWSFGPSPPEESYTCEELDSDPSYLTCGYEPSCTVCGELFPDKEICESYYAINCGKIHCFCKPYCSSQDCLFSRADRSNNQSFEFT